MGFLLTIHIIVCILLVITVLLQIGKGASTGAVFGGGVQTVFGPTGASSFLEKVVVTLFIIFVITDLSLSVFGGGRPPKISP